MVYGIFRNSGYWSLWEVGQGLRFQGFKVAPGWRVPGVLRAYVNPKPEALNPKPGWGGGGGGAEGRAFKGVGLA